MKTFALAALVAVVVAQEDDGSAPAEFPGDYCDNDSSACQETFTTCASWKDSDGYPRKSCQDCAGSNRLLSDEYGVQTTFVCPGEETDASTSLVASAVALLAAATMMA